MAGILSRKQLDQFESGGFLIVEDVVDAGTIEAVKDEYVERLGEVADAAYAAGEVASSYAELPFEERYAKLVFENRKVFDHLDITLPLDHDGLPPDASAHTGPAALSLLSNACLLDAVESVLGPEILCNPVQHVRMKPPRGNVSDEAAKNSYIGDTNWHQDAAVYLDEAKESDILTVWVAITDATPENGCMICVPRSHREQTLTPHCPGNGIVAENYIPWKLIEDDAVVPLPVRSGGIILLNQYLQHTALPNRTDSMRWSFDLRYNPTGHATGRPAFPGFIARSQRRPGLVLRDAGKWTRLWDDAKQRLISGEYEGQVFNEDRWASNRGTAICA